MKHLHAEPSSECAGRLSLADSHAERVYDRRASAWFEVVRATYQCEGCGDYVTLDRRCVNLEGQLAPVVKLEFRIP